MTTSDLYTKAAELASVRQPFAIATVVRVEGSASARAGSKALINAQGKIVMGWVGGGCAESTVRTVAVRCIERGAAEFVTLDMSDEILGVGMPCGGKMDVYIEPVSPKPELLVVGHGKIAETLASLAHLMNFFVIVNDPGATPDAFPGADRLVAEDFDLSETPICSSSHVVIATQHKADHLWLKKALDGGAAYVALIASHHRAQLVLDYLAAEGVPAEKLHSVHAPAGLDLGAQSPEEIALSIVSEIVALRNRAAIMRMNQGWEAESDLPSTSRVISHCETDRE